MDILRITDRIRARDQEVPARGDHMTSEFGRAPPPEEKEWGKVVLERVLTV
jgi:hypothetical protein